MVLAWQQSKLCAFHLLQGKGKGKGKGKGSSSDEEHPKVETHPPTYSPSAYPSGEPSAYPTHGKGKVSVRNALVLKWCLLGNNLSSVLSFITGQRKG